MDIDQNRSVLVTGGRGFIGRAAVKLLRRAGYGVVSADQVPGAGAIGSTADEQVCDISDEPQLHRIFQERQIGGIIHLAAILPTAAQRDPGRATQVNVGGSLNMLESARRFRVPRVVFGSSLSVYGTWPADHVVAETGRAAPEDLYGAGKLYVDRLGESYSAGHGLEFVSLRIGRVVGPGALSVTSPWRSQIFELLDTRQPAEIVIPYASSEKLLLVHVEDIAKMLVTLLEAPCPADSFYNAPSEPIVVADLKREVEELNSKIAVRLGKQSAVGNPRLLDASRFQREFSFEMTPIFARLKRTLGTRSL